MIISFASTRSRGRTGTASRPLVFETNASTDSMRAGEHWTAKIRKIIHTPSGKWENRRVKGRGSRRFAYLCGQWRELFISRTLNWNYLGFCVVFGRGQPVKRKLPVSGRREACLPVSDRQASMLWWTAMWPEGSPRFSKPRA